MKAVSFEIAFIFYVDYDKYWFFFNILLIFSKLKCNALHREKY